MADLGLKGKVAIVTGAGSGIGAAGARLMAEAGAAVVVAEIRPDGGRAVVAEIEAAGGRATFLPVDVRSSDSVQALVAGTVAHYGRIDVLFHNAMNVPLVNREDRRATDLPESVWQQIIDLVLTGTFLCCKYVGRQMLQQRSGSLILTATTDAQLKGAGPTPYSASKAGVISLVQNVANELYGTGVRVNAICPGFVHTPIVDKQIEDQARTRGISPEKVMSDVILAAQPTKQFVTTDQLAGLFLYLVSDLGASANGASFSIDGGWTAQ